MSFKKPDILLIILDTLRRDRLSAYGYDMQTSPEFDAFAAESMFFERAIAPAQWTIPCHASLFTGLYPSQHQLTQGDQMLSGSFPTLAEILQVEGYHTAAFCNNALLGVLGHGLQRGFTDFYNYAGAAPHRPVTVHKRGKRRILSRQWSRFARAVSNQFAHSDWLFRVSLRPVFTPIWTRYINYKGHTTNSINDMMHYIQHHRRQRPETPQFTFLNLMGTHLPYHPPETVLRRFAPEFGTAEHRFMRQFNADAARWASPDDPPLSADERHIIERFYDAEIAHQDAHLGRLLRWLKDAGVLDDTMVIIAADHGEAHGEHGFFGHSFTVYQELVHVPMLIHYPERFPQRRRIQTNVSTRRIFHTILDAAGIHPPPAENDPNGDAEALSLVRSVDGQADTENDTAFAEAMPPQQILNMLRHRNSAIIDQRQLDLIRRAVYAADHKLTTVGQDIEALFEIGGDPAEMCNLKERRPALSAHLLQRLIDFSRRATQNGRALYRRDEDVDAAVVENLRALGYIE